MDVYNVFRYSRSCNLGDAIQTVALSRLLPGPVFSFSREEAEGLVKGAICVVNGWLGENVIPNSGDFLFAGVHLAKMENLPWLARSRFPIGARDPWTKDRIMNDGLSCALILCATLTFERYSSVRRGIYHVDCRGTGIRPPKSAVEVTHSINPGLPWPAQWARALQLLQIYRKAAAVYTTRLHVALPCLAFGTPVFLIDPLRVCHPDDAVRRFGVTKLLGLRFNNMSTIDVTAAANTYKLFLENTLNAKLVSKPLEFLPLV